MPFSSLRIVSSLHNKFSLTSQESLFLTRQSTLQNVLLRGALQRPEGIFEGHKKGAQGHIALPTRLKINFSAFVYAKHSRKRGKISLKIP